MPSGAGVSAFGLAVVLGHAVTAASCAGSHMAPATPSIGPAPTFAASPSGAANGSPQLAWSTMTADQRRNYMQAVVMPKMKELFVAFNAATRR